ncbi:MAG: hypothetical protein Q8Q48_01165 [Candidatus Staskawiczbacteria bacterium]|nr:hypothetical protein [Candidatus Staskawiczbacteria bacterium]
MAEEETLERVDAHVLLLDRIGSYCALPDEEAEAPLKDACGILRRIKVPPECLKGVYEKLVGFLTEKSGLDRMTDDKVVRKRMDQLRNCIRDIGQRMAEQEEAQPKAPKKRNRPARNRPASAPVPGIQD